MSSASSPSGFIPRGAPASMTASQTAGASLGWQNTSLSVFSFTSPHTLRVVRSGSTFTVYLDGVQRQVRSVGLTGCQTGVVAALILSMSVTAHAQNASTIPTQCADGTAGTSFSNTAPNVTLFARDFAAPRSWRGNLQWSGPVLANRFSAMIDGTLSLNQWQQGVRAARDHAG